MYVLDVSSFPMADTVPLTWYAAPVAVEAILFIPDRGQVLVFLLELLSLHSKELVPCGAGAGSFDDFS